MVELVLKASSRKLVFSTGCSSGDSMSDSSLENNRRKISDDDVDEYEIERKIDEEKKLARNWAVDSDRSLFWAAPDVSPKIDPGLYKCIRTDQTGFTFKKMLVKTDDLIMFDDDAMTTTVIKEVEDFWKKRQDFVSHGYLHKRGILMYGDPGVGKTGTIQQLVKKLIGRGGIAIYADDPHLLTGCLQLLRRIEPDRPCIVILEDFETLTNRDTRENEWLSVLDGEAQVDNVVFLATTNYIEKLDKRFTDRPSRFDRVIQVKFPSDRIRAYYLINKAPEMDLKTVKKWVKATKGFSIAHLKELVISCFCMNNSPDQIDAVFKSTLERLRAMRKRDFQTEQVDPETGEVRNSLGFVHTEVEPEPVLDWDRVAQDLETIREKVKAKKTGK